MKEGTKLRASDVLSRREKKKRRRGEKACRLSALVAREREREREREEREEREEGEEGEEGEEVQMLLSSLASPCCVIVSDKLV